MSKRLFVGGLPYSITSEKLEELFSEVGEVNSASVIMDRDSGRSKGFGFVDISDEAADEAIAKFNDSEIEGRKIVVNIARPREERPRFNDRRSGGQNDRRGFDRRDNRGSRRRDY